MSVTRHMIAPVQRRLHATTMVVRLTMVVETQAPVATLTVTTLMLRVTHRTSNDDVTHDPIDSTQSKSLHEIDNESQSALLRATHCSFGV